MEQLKKIPVTALLCVACAALGLVHFGGAFKVMTLCAGVGIVALLCAAELSPLKNFASLSLLGFVCFSGLTAFWAMSGKFFLKEFDKIFLAAGVFLIVVLFRRGRDGYEKRVCEVVAGVSAIYAALSVEAAATGVTERALHALGYLPDMSLSFESGTRLTGIFGNANTLSAALALGVLLSVALLCAAQGKWQRRVYAALLAINAFALLLGFSMGALACFFLSVIVYLAAAGERRGEVLLHMLCGAIPTVICASAAFPFFGRDGAARAVPLLLLCADAALAIVLEEKAFPRAEGIFRAKQRAVFGALTALVLLAVCYAALGLRLSGPYTFGDSLRRGVYPAPGDYTLSVTADGGVDVTIISQNRAQTMMHTETVLYSGSAAGAVFTVPEDSEVCYFTFTAQPGVTLSAASYDGMSIPLDYTLLPGFVANRLQGLRANQNAIQRVVFMADGMKLFRLSPVVGNGVGAFETGVTRVQEFSYVTRYVHNHYVQTLLESGVIGLALYLCALAGMAALLWRGRARQSWLYGALAASLTMIVAHPIVEVPMSFVVFLCCAYAVFGLIVRTCAPEREAAGRGMSLANVLAAALPAVFLFTLCGNMYAAHMLKRPMDSTAQAFETMEKAERLDAYERMDILLTYVVMAQEDGNDDWEPQANIYAERLAKQQSNSIPIYLVGYYLNTAQYEKAIEAAKLGAVYSASDATTWNGCSDFLRQIFYDSGSLSPLHGENGERLTELLREYYAMLLEHNASSMEPVVLAAANQEFFESL